MASPGWALTVLRDLSRSCPGLRRRAGGVKLERPQPRSGEDERVGRRRGAADHRDKNDDHHRAAAQDAAIVVRELLPYLLTATR